MSRLGFSTGPHAAAKLARTHPELIPDGRQVVAAPKTEGGKLFVLWLEGDDDARDFLGVSYDDALDELQGRTKA